MEKNNLKKLTLKETIRRIDFVFIILFGLFLCFLLYTNEPRNSRARVGAHMLLFLIPIMTVVLSNLRYKFVYGTEEYRKKIRDHQKKVAQFTSIPSKKLVLAIIWCGSLAPIITNLAQEKYFNSLLVLMFAIGSSIVLSNMIDAKLKQEKILGVKARKVKFSHDYRAIALLPIIIAFLLFSSFFLLLKGEFFASLLTFIMMVFFSLALSFHLRK